MLITATQSQVTLTLNSDLSNQGVPAPAAPSQTPLGTQGAATPRITNRECQLKSSLSALCVFSSSSSSSFYSAALRVCPRQQGLPVTEILALLVLARRLPRLRRLRGAWQVVDKGGGHVESVVIVVRTCTDICFVVYFCFLAGIISCQFHIVTLARGCKDEILQTFFHVEG